MCKKYESYLNLSAHDPVAKIVQAVSEGRNPPFSPEVIESCKASKGAQSFLVDHRFLLTEKNLVYCSLTHAPVPQRLALRQRAQTQDE
ncbi:regulator of chromosome condensation domain-containing protein, putative [Eimeria praecox]|uniref:Regulator of chromosome condensation domain-containing protein, putative n=1 Tax=Eimeria praecox TaxID=51316 RepID=U6GAE7_9EIME|nr:regulator of chromosome condensation domain-containing protein, putative [Eimeria praecox]